MTTGFKRVPAIDKCFSILALLSKSREPLGISDVAKSLGFNRSTVFNTVYTLVDLGILEKRNHNKFHFGTQLYMLSRAAIGRFDLMNTIRPYMEEINQKTRLMVFLGIRSGLKAVIIDKVDSTFDIKVMAEVGMKIPLLAGAGGKALLSQLSDRKIEQVLSTNELKAYTPNSCTDRQAFRTMIHDTRKTGIALDMEEYIEGIRAIAVPLNVGKENMEDVGAAIWVIGLKNQIQDDLIDSYSTYLKQVADRIETQLSPM